MRLLTPLIFLGGLSSAVLSLTNLRSATAFFAYGWVMLPLAIACGGSATVSEREPADARASFAFEVWASLDTAPGNIAVMPSGEVWVTAHQFFAPSFVAGRVEGNRLVPLDVSSFGRTQLVSPLGIATDSHGGLWLLDNALADSNAPPQLVRRKGHRVEAWDLSEAAPANAFVNDFAIDETTRYIYIADPAGGDNAALIVLGPEGSRRVLEGHESVRPEPIDLVIDGEPVEMLPNGERIRPHIGVNPIALGPRDEWLYYGPMHGRSMYRVPTVALRNEALTPAELAASVERFASKPICDGIAIDDAGHLYLGDLANNAIGVIHPDGSYQELMRDPRLSWVDAFAIGPDRQVYAAVNQLHRSATLHGGENVSVPPYLVVRFPALPGADGQQARPGEQARPGQQEIADVGLGASECEEVPVDGEAMWGEHMLQLFTGFSTLFAMCQMEEGPLCTALPGPPEQLSSWAGWLGQQPPFPAIAPCDNVAFNPGAGSALIDLGFSPEKVRSSFSFEQRGEFLTIVQTQQLSCNSRERVRYELDLFLTEGMIARTESARRCGGVEAAN